MAEGIGHIEVDAAATLEGGTALHSTVWASDSKSWQEQPGEISTLHPCNARTFLKDYQQLERDDFELRQIACCTLASLCHNPAST